VNFSVNFDSVEKRQIAQRTVQLRGQNRLKIYDLLHLIIEPHTQSIWCNNLEVFHAVNGMSHY